MYLLLERLKKGMNINTSLTKENNIASANNSKVLIYTSLIGCQALCAKIGNAIYHCISIILSEQHLHHPKQLRISLGLDFSEKRNKSIVSYVLFRSTVKTFDSKKHRSLSGQEKKIPQTIKHLPNNTKLLETKPTPKRQHSAADIPGKGEFCFLLWENVLAHHPLIIPQKLHPKET